MSPEEIAAVHTMCRARAGLKVTPDKSYLIESRLGSGGMSTVHLVVDERLERYVACKLRD